MLIETLLVAHVAVLGYWLGSELVINANFRYVSRAAALPFAERDRLFDHVLDMDQHVRYALILQLGLGTALAALLGYVPGGSALAIGAAVFAVAWLALVEMTHRLRKTRSGRRLAQLDQSLRYAMVVILVLVGNKLLLASPGLPFWLRAKLALFAGVIICGLGIRLALIRFYHVWRDLEQSGTTPALERAIRRRYWQATAVLIVLWVCIAGIVALSVLKP